MNPPISNPQTDNREQVETLMDRMAETMAASQVGGEMGWRDEIKYLAKRAHIDTIKDNNANRKTFAIATFYLTVGWIAACLSIVILSGCNVLKLSDAVIITLITSTTGSVFGFFILVMRYLFNIKFLPSFKKVTDAESRGAMI